VIKGTAKGHVFTTAIHNFERKDSVIERVFKDSGVSLKVLDDYAKTPLMLTLYKKTCGGENLASLELSWRADLVLVKPHKPQSLHSQGVVSKLPPYSRCYNL